VQVDALLCPLLAHVSSCGCLALQVLMLVWDDKSNNYPLPIAGVMGTHDNETYAYFKGTKVECVLCPRQGGTEDSYLQVKRGGAGGQHSHSAAGVWWCGLGGLVGAGAVAGVVGLAAGGLQCVLCVEAAL
jgi:hypothetical protein